MHRKGHGEGAVQEAQARGTQPHQGFPAAIFKLVYWEMALGTVYANEPACSPRPPHKRCSPSRAPQPTNLPVPTAPCPWAPCAGPELLDGRHRSRSVPCWCHPPQNKAQIALLGLAVLSNVVLQSWSPSGVPKLSQPL